MNKKAILIFSVLAVAAAGMVLYFGLFGSDVETETLKINNTKIEVEIADTEAEIKKGLSGRDYLKDNKGMLFVFEKEGFYSFWMKGMKFPLDFIWIREGKILEITENVKPKDYQPPKALAPENKIDQVLEVKAGFVKENGAKIGNRVEILKK